jgi:hypothetical protein
MKGLNHAPFGQADPLGTGHHKVVEHPHINQREGVRQALGDLLICP